MRALGLAAAYAALYKLIVLETSFGTSVGATFWPGAGLTVAVLVLRPTREWPAFVAALAATEYLLDVNGGYTPAVSAAMAVANCAEPVVAAALLRTWLPSAPDLSRLRDLGLFLAAAVFAGPLLGALIGSVVPWLLGIDPVWPRLGRWYLGDALGVIVIAPLLISVARPPSKPLLRRSQSWTFAVLLITALVALPWSFAANLGLPFVVIPALALIGIRMGTRAAAAGVLVVGVLVETVTAVGIGAFAGAGSFTGLLAAQMYIATCAATALVAAALMTGLVSRDELALHDSLTGLANRRLLIDRLSVACRRLARTPGSVSVLFIDLDRFKAINDRHGHLTGDAVLIETGRRLKDVTRAQDTVARIGGDEFVILAEELDGSGALANLVQRVQQSIEQPIETGDGRVLQVGASIGCSVCDRPGVSPELVLSRADSAMYNVKHDRRDAGRVRV